jgi:hypothetical protein
LVGLLVCWLCYLVFGLVIWFDLVSFLFQAFGERHLREFKISFEIPGAGCFDQRKKIARARILSRAPRNGLETANQKETFQAAVRFIFTLLSQAFGERHFTEREISF